MSEKDNQLNEQQIFYNQLNLIIGNEDFADTIEDFVNKNIENSKIDKFLKYDQLIGNPINKKDDIGNRIYLLEYLIKHKYEYINYSTQKELLNALAYKKWQNHDFNEAIAIVKKYKLDFKERTDLAYATCLNIYGLLNYKLDNKEKALEVFYEALNVLDKSKESLLNQKRSITIQNNIALIYRNQNEFDNAIKIINQNVVIQEKLADRIGVSSSYMNMGSVYSLKKEYKKAIEYSLKAQKIKYELGDLFLANRINLNLASFYYETGNLELVKKYIGKCLESNDEQIKKLITGIILKLQLENYNKSKKTSLDKEKLMKAANSCLKNINELKNNSYKLEYYATIAKALESTGNTKKALDLHVLNFEIYKEQNDKDKEKAYKALRQVHEIQMQQKELEKKEILLKEKEKTNLKLQQINKDLEQFTYMASHDLKTPLRNIITFSSLIEKEKTTKKEILEFVKLIKSDGKKMYKLITALLKYSKIGYLEVSFEEVILKDLLKKVINGLKREIKAKNAIINIDVESNIMGNSILLEQLFENLITNALKYNDKEIPKIEIKGSHTKEGLIMTIEDNGIGIPLNKKDEVFKAFVRAHSDSIYKGSGVGLSTCKKIMDIHSGTISVSSEVGEGSCFTLAFNSK